ncbi:ATP-binding protein [Streptomyces sp. NPDC020362]|uniref:ATP-binding protein n=1 Tax=unclassified Streptomyces TaxID=2593676 RepID=UPI000B055478
MTRIVNTPEGKNWEHRSWWPLFVRNYASRVTHSMRQAWNSFHMRLVAQRRIPSPSTWRMKWPLWRCMAWILAAVFIFWFLLGLYTLVFGYSGTWLARWCGDAGMACGIVSGTLSPLLTLGFTTAVFLIVFYPKASRRARKLAKEDPHSLVPTAGTIIEDVVGRQELCQILMRALHDRKIRRPYIVVGSVGTGKTAVLVQLTQMLAQKNAVPVPVRLRDVSKGDSSLDFAEAARKRFCEIVDTDLVSGQHGERAWRQLLADERAVVIADGLEELFAEGEQEKERDIAIRNAIKLAEKQRLPLVIASRPHPPLEESDAAIINLEPLSEEAALDYLAANYPAPDKLRLDWIVETAVVSESPLYLQIARQLRQHHRLEYLTNKKEWEDLDTRRADRWALRLRLLDEWKNALIKGRIYEKYALPARHRYETLEVISALACIGLLKDTIEVRFNELIDPAEVSSEDQKERTEDTTDTSSLEKVAIAALRLGRQAMARRRRTVSASEFPEIWQALRDRVADGAGNSLPYGRDVSACLNALCLYATQGDNLGLVETKGDKVRFHHSIIQAYLGSRFMSVISDDHLRNALRAPKPGRELLMALVLNSRMAGRKADRPDLGLSWRTRQQYRRLAAADLLVGEFGSRKDGKVFDMYAAALQIDRMAGQSEGDLHQWIAEEIVRNWNEVTVGDKQSIDAAKENLVHRFGETARELGAARARKDPSDPAHAKRPAFDQLFEIVLKEPTYHIRLAAVQEFGASGDDAFGELRRRFPVSTGKRPSPIQYDPWKQYRTTYRKVQREERAELERLTREGEMRGSVDPAFRERERYYSEKKLRIRREYIARAWLVPMMVGSVTKRYRRQAKERVELWLRHLDCDRPGAGRAELPVILEISLAQGFKFAANRRRRHPSANEETREFMVQQAEFMLSRARYWYSQLTLIHALCLWKLPDALGETSLGDSRAVPKGDASRIVGRWLGMAGSKRDPRSIKFGDIGSDGRERLHPFVAEAAELGALAIETGRPERYLWIDEKGAMENVGSASCNPSAPRKHNLWIPPSAGWSALHPRAQQLLADVLLLINLAEREGDPDEVDARLEKANQTILPPCLTKSREPLHPDRTVGRADDAAPGSMCMPDCPFEMCPYPAKGQQQRAEFPEIFCRQQQALLRPYRRWRLSWLLWWLRNPVRHQAAWQDTRKKELIGFWGAMAMRSRTRGG